MIYLQFFSTSGDDQVNMGDSIQRNGTAQGGTWSIHDGGVWRSFILQTQKNTQAWNFRPKKIPGIEISNLKNKIFKCTIVLSS